MENALIKTVLGWEEGVAGWKGMTMRPRSFPLGGDVVIMVSGKESS